MTKQFLLLGFVLAACGSSGEDPRHAGDGSAEAGAPSSGVSAGDGENTAGAPAEGGAPEAGSGGAATGGTTGPEQGGVAGTDQGGARDGGDDGGEGGDGSAIRTDVAVTMRVGRAGGTLAGPHGASVTFPAGALGSSTEIVVALDGSNAPSFPPAGVAVVSATFEISPHGLSFGAPVTVRIPFEPYALPEGTSPALYRAEAGGEFVEIPSTLDGDALVAEVSDFSVFAVGAYVAQEYVYTNDGHQYLFDAARDTLNPLSPSTVTTGRNPWAIGVTPLRGFAYIGSDGESGSTDPFLSISQYDIGPGGVLTPLSPAQVILGRTDELEGIGYLVVHPSGSAVYATTWGAGPVVRVLKTGSDGKLGAPSLVNPQGGVGDPRDPYPIKLDAKGEYAYVFGGFTPPGSVWQFTVGADGSLTQGPSAAIADVWAHDLAVAPLAKNVYTLDWGSAAARSLNVFLYRQDDSGVLAAPVTVATFPADTFSLDRIAITPDGKSAYVAGADAARNPFIAQFAIKADGTFSPLGGDTITAGAGNIFDIDPLGKYLFTGTVPDFPLRTYPIGPTGLLGAPRTIAAGALQATGGSNPVALAYSKPAGCPLCGNGQGGGPISPPDKPQGPFTLSVTHGVWGGWITSIPAGIDYGHDWVLGSPNQFSAQFDKGTQVVLCAIPPPSPVQAYDVIWTGDCANIRDKCSGVLLDRDKTCHLELTLR